MRWIHFFLLAVVFIFAAQFIHYLIKGTTFKFKNPVMPSILAVILAYLATAIQYLYFLVLEYIGKF